MIHSGVCFWDRNCSAHNITKGILYNYVLSICFCSIFFFCAQAQPQAELGVLDLREVDFSEQSSVPIYGDWRLQVEETLEDDTGKSSSIYSDPSKGWFNDGGGLFGSHQKGSAIYSLEVLMPTHQENFSVRIPIVNTAYEFYVNEQLVIKVGKVGRSQLEGQPYWQHVTQSVKLNPGKNEIRLVMSNFDHHRAGMYQPISIGEEEYMNTVRNLHVGGVLFLAGCLLVAGVFALGLFWFKTSEVAGLVFFLFCVSYCIWVISSSYYVIPSVLGGLSWLAVLRIEYISLAVSTALYGYFIKASFEDKIKLWIFNVIAIVSGVFIITVLVSGSLFFTQLYPYFIGFSALTYLYIAINGLQLAEFSHKLTWVNIIGVLALVSVIGLRILEVNGWILEIRGIDVIGNVIFVLSQALFMAIMFGRNYRMSSLAALAAARTRDEFLNTMSHELKTPMNAILGMATFLEKSKLTKSQRDKLRAIKTNGESLMSLITDVLSISEVGSGKLRLKLGVLSIESCVESALSLSKQHLQKEGVVFTSYIDPRIPQHLKGDSSRLKQVLMHILNRAFKSTSKGRVELRINLDQEEEDVTYVNFEVVDTGTRAKQRSSSPAFSLFNESAEDEDVDKGGEVGLKVVEELVELMGGVLVAEKNKPKGSKVSFTLALQRYDSSDQRKVTSIFKRNEVDRTLKILYAEDNPVNQKLIVLMLDALGLKVDIAQNGEEAVEMATKKYYNIILMDINMPVMDGLEASRRIIQSSNARPVIIAATANMAEVDKRKCFEAGMNDFLSKPINQDDLKLAIIKWQGLKQYLDESDDSIIQLSS